MVSAMSAVPSELLLDKMRNLGVKICIIYDEDLRPIIIRGVPKELGYMGIGLFAEQNETRKIVWLKQEDAYLYKVERIQDSFLNPYFFPARGGKILKITDILRGDEY